MAHYIQHTQKHDQICGPVHPTHTETSSDFPTSNTHRNMIRFSNIQHTQKHQICGPLHPTHTETSSDLWPTTSNTHRNIIRFSNIQHTQKHDQICGPLHPTHTETSSDFPTSNTHRNIIRFVAHYIQHTQKHDQIFHGVFNFFAAVSDATVSFAANKSRSYDCFFATFDDDDKNNDVFQPQEVFMADKA